VRDNTREPTGNEFRQCLDLGEELSPYYWRIKPFSWERFNYTLDNEVDGTCSPGYPFNSYGVQTNQQILDSPSLRRNLYERVLNRFSELEHGPIGDPVKVFIKQEPHTLKKAKDKRWRLIQGVGLIDAIVDRHLLGGFNEAVDNLAKDCQGPLLAGWSPFEGGWKTLMGRFASPVASDKSSWDWTLQPWLVEWSLEMLKRLCLSSEWHNVLANRWSYVFGHQTYQVGNVLLVKEVKGIMTTGFFGTITINSLCQLGLHLLATSRTRNQRYTDAVFLGDDVDQEEPDPDYWEHLPRTGCILKDYQKTPGYPNDFCGVVLKESGPTPLYPEKNFYHLLTGNPEHFPETLECYQRLYAHSAQFPLLQRLAEKVGVPISQGLAKSWYDGY